MSNRAGRARGALEREVLACLATADRPLTANDVLSQLGGDLAYTTVMTTLSRLNAKHAVTRTVTGRAYAYSLAGGPEGARAAVTAHQMHRLLEGGDDRSSVLSRFIAELSPKDEQLLQDLLKVDSSAEKPPEATQAESP